MTRPDFKIATLSVILWREQLNLFTISLKILYLWRDFKMTVIIAARFNFIRFLQSIVRYRVTHLMWGRLPPFL
jgi:hypothetical protein